MVNKGCIQEYKQDRNGKMQKIALTKDVSHCWQELKCTQHWFCPTSPFYTKESFELECIQLYFPNDEY